VFIHVKLVLNLRYMSTLGNKKVELFDMGAGVSGEPTAEENVQVASCESLCILVFSCHQNMSLLRTIRD